MMDGGLCEWSIIRADKLHPSEELSFDQLALVETLAIGCHASDRGNPKEGEHALVIGAGPIGLATLEFNRLTQTTLSVMDMSEERLEFCRANYGIENLIHFKGDGSEKQRMLEITNGTLFDLVTDATGNPHSMSGALDFVAHTGRLVYGASPLRKSPSNTRLFTARKSICSLRGTPCPRISPVSSS